MLLQTLVTGLAIGGIYALMASGYSLIFSIMGFSNIAYGTIIMLGSYIGFFAMTRFGQPFYIALGLAMVGAAMLSMLTERIAYRPLRERGAPSLFLMISAMGISILLENLVYVFIGGSFYPFPPIFKLGTVTVFGATLGFLDIFAIVFSFGAIYILNAFITKTRIGIGIRAASYDNITAMLNGVNLNSVIAIVFLISGLLAGLSGVFFGMKYMVYPGMGAITTKAYIAAVIGGLGSLPGAVIGGVILGVLESFVSVYVSSSFRDVFSFSLLIIILIFMPNGLFGKEAIEKV
jgi:branched-chain amino acid transport system permease protein